MAKKRYINTKFWSDSYIVNLDPLERYLFLYFLTNEHTDISGIYELPLRRIAQETGLSEEMAETITKRFEKEGKIIIHNSWVYIKNFNKHQVMNTSVRQGIKHSLSEVPKKILNFFREADPDCNRLCTESDIS
ncbi:MAG TPA: hypothetical protein VF679_01060 [Pedobacter sp.]|jgi:hypothetical protein